MLVLRTTPPLAAAASSVREVVSAVDPDVTIVEVAPFRDLLQAPLARPRFNAFLIGGFGAAALFLATIGSFAVIAASVRQRYREIGVRVALGATASDVRSMVLGEGVRLAALGAAMGLLGALLSGWLLRDLLFGVDPLDPVSLSAAALLLVAASALAAYIPARRAARVDPAVVLRSGLL